jgi:predicted phage terminase large subunit-like protein
LSLKCKEAFFGGAAGGGKSDCLLRAALQYVHVPKYSALVLRTSTTDLRLSGGLIPKSHQWLTGKAHWNGNDSKWTFPNGATLQFGYLSNSQDKFRYRSSEFQYIAFDELTDFTEEDYLFMFSRIRQTVDIDVPERIRAASNPGGRGHEWVKNRFITKELSEDLVNNTLRDVYWIPSGVDDEGPRASVPSKIKDNPAIDPKKYVKNLMHLGPVMRERMMNGDWTVMPTGLIKADWLRYFTMQDKMVKLLVSKKDDKGNMLHTNEVAHIYHEQESRRFVTIDTAGGMKDITSESKGKPHSWTVIGVWDFKRYGSSQALLLRYVWRDRVGFTEVAQAIANVFHIWKPTRIRVEDQTMGPSLQNLLMGKMPIDLIATEGKDKVTRAATLMNMMEAGQVYLPQGENSWRPAWESEVLSWQGVEEQTNDQIDMSAYAAIEACGGMMQGAIQLDLDPRKEAIVGTGRGLDGRGWAAGAVRW